MSHPEPIPESVPESSPESVPESSPGLHPVHEPEPQSGPLPSAQLVHSPKSRPLPEPPLQHYGFQSGGFQSCGKAHGSGSPLEKVLVRRSRRASMGGTVTSAMQSFSCHCSSLPGHRTGYSSPLYPYVCVRFTSVV